jgi:septin family protein
VIAVMGVTGAGKTSFIQHFFPHPLDIGHNLESCSHRSCHEPKTPLSTLSIGTTAVQIFPCRLSDGTKVFLVDTPGFDDTYRSDTEVLRELADWLSQAYEYKLLLTGIVYMHRITDVRIGGSGMKNLRMFRKLCGQGGLRSVACVTSMWSLCSADDGQRRERQLMQQNDLWKYLLDNGVRAFRHDANKASAERILRHLIQQRRPVALDIQVEMVDHGLRLSQTAAGKEVQGDLDKLKEQHQQEMQEIRAEMEDAIREKDLERRKELEEYQKQIQQQVAKQEEEMKRLEASREQLRREMQEQHSRELASMRSEWERRRSSSNEDGYGERVVYQQMLVPYLLPVQYVDRGLDCVIL